MLKPHTKKTPKTTGSKSDPSRMKRIMQKLQKNEEKNPKKEMNIMQR